jgi:predicted nucleic acid-binding protein
MKVFVDTSALFAILDGDDREHGLATRIFEGLVDTAELVTTNYVHVEAEQLVRRRLGPQAANELSDELLPIMSTVWIDEPTHRAAVEAQRVGGGKASLVDHVSFVVMRRAGIEVAFAFDTDFEAQGFRRPPPEARRSHRLSEGQASYGMDVAPEEAPSPAAVELVSVAEISARSGRPTNTIQSWRRRHGDFPAPIATLAAGPVWHWPAVSRWIASRGAGQRRPAAGPG